MDDTDPMVSVMKLEKAPQESYADIGGLDQQIQEIKVVQPRKKAAATRTTATIAIVITLSLSLSLSLSPV